MSLVPKKLTLPKQTLPWQYYQLADGSRLYPSGVYYHGESKKCLWFVWRYLYDSFFEGKHTKEGEILLCPTGIRYFSTPDEALQALQELR